jgi:hypothetical protein
MNTAHLIAQLLDIEQAVGKVEPARIRGMLFEAEATVLELEKQMIEILTDYEGLQMLMDFSRRANSPSALPDPAIPEKFFVN